MTPVIRENHFTDHLYLVVNKGLPLPGPHVNQYSIPMNPESVRTCSSIPFLIDL